MADVLFFVIYLGLGLLFPFHLLMAKDHLPTEMIIYEGVDRSVEKSYVCPHRLSLWCLLTMAAW